MVDVDDSINPFANLATAPPTTAPSLAKRKASSALSKAPSTTAGRESEGGKTGWKRISTREWVRDFRTFAKECIGVNGKRCCKSCFVTSGYYPDMVKDEMYQKYLAKFPANVKKESVMSEKMVFKPRTAAESSLTSSITSTTNVTSSTLPSTTSTEFFAAYASRKKRSAGFRDQIKKIHKAITPDHKLEDVAATPSEGNIEVKKKGKKGKHGSADSEMSAMSGDLQERSKKKSTRKTKVLTDAVDTIVSTQHKTQAHSDITS